MRRYRKRLREQAPPDKLVACGAAEIKRTAKRLRADEAKRSRAAKIAAIAARTQDNPKFNVSTKYPVILADPPWEKEFPAAGKFFPGRAAGRKHLPRVGNVFFWPRGHNAIRPIAAKADPRRTGPAQWRAGKTGACCAPGRCGEVQPGDRTAGASNLIAPWLPAVAPGAGKQLNFR
jgi:hypothetical protein